MERVIGIFRATAMAVPDPDALAMTALSYLLTVGPQMGWTPTVDTAVTFLDQGAPDLDRAVLVRALTTTGPDMATTDQARQFLSELAARLGGLSGRGGATRYSAACSPTGQNRAPRPSGG